MTRSFQLLLTGAVAFVAPAAMAQNQPSQPVIFSALVGPGPLTPNSVTTFNFTTPNGDVDLNRPGAFVVTDPGDASIFFLAPPGDTIGAAGDGIDAILDSSAGLLD